jgi:P27 family predicted phage terminase small subunit
MRPRKPEVLHSLQGTRPHDRVDVSHVQGGRPRFPKDLDKSLRPVFKRIVRLLTDRRVITEGDADLVRLYCFSYERHQRQVALLRQEGEVVSFTWTDDTGTHTGMKANIRLKIVVDAEKQMANILAQLGLTQLSKDRAKPTREDVGPRVVPGSVGHLYPELLEGGNSSALEFKPPASISPNDMEVCETEQVEANDGDKTVG